MNFNGIPKLSLLKLYERNIEDYNKKYCSKQGLLNTLGMHGKLT